ncbi:chorismate mutase [Celeribacter arenosi]|uniref:chorismate mutase n=1 Tax=Celeribacter arenosi TaxID=792649 RepID=A0ABP7K7U5_9RHOB
MTYIAPEDIPDMAALRAQIDRLDGEILERLAFRQAHVDRAAQLKTGTGIKANVPARVDEVLAKVHAKAQAAGFDADLAVDMWRLMIDAMIAREERAMNEGDAP